MYGNGCAGKNPVSYTHLDVYKRQDLNTVDLAVKTGNAMADAIINSKISLAKSRNIPVQDVYKRQP